MKRIAILDHNEHKLYIEDIPDEILDAPELGGEEAISKVKKCFEKLPFLNKEIYS